MQLLGRLFFRPEVAVCDAELSVGGEFRPLWAGLGGEADRNIVLLDDSWTISLLDAVSLVLMKYMFRITDAQFIILSDFVLSA